MPGRHGRFCSTDERDILREPPWPDDRALEVEAAYFAVGPFQTGALRVLRLASRA